VYSGVFRFQAEETVEHPSRSIVNAEYRRLIRDIDYKSPRPQYIAYGNCKSVTKLGKVLHVFLHGIHELNI
jgi:hypothetical protein